MFLLTPEGHGTAAVSRRAWGQDTQPGASGLMECSGLHRRLPGHGQRQTPTQKYNEEVQVVKQIFWHRVFMKDLCFTAFIQWKQYIQNFL